MMDQTTIDRAFDMAEAFSQKLGELAAQYGPNVVDLALQTARVGAIQELVYGSLALAIAVTAITVAVRILPVHRTEGQFVVGIIAAFMSVPSTMVTLDKFANAYAWVGVFHPEVWLAKEVLGL